MSFKDYLENYKNGTASPEEIKIVEEELEKFEALNDFAYENLENQIDGLFAESPGSDDFQQGESEDGEASGTKTNISGRTSSDRKYKPDSEQFIKQINREIKKTFVKIGVCSGACVLVIVLFLVFGLSPFMNMFFYDPTKPMWETEDETDYAPERLAVDLSVYSELMMPLNKYDSAVSLKQGYGKYYFTASKLAWFTAEGTPKTIAGEITRNNLQIFTPDVMERPSPNIMGIVDDANKDSVMYGMSPKDALIDIQELEKNEGVRAYVTFNKDLSYIEASEFLHNYDTVSSWFGVRLPGNTMGFGFTSDTSGDVYSECKINNKYPALLFNDAVEVLYEFDSEERSEYFQNHFLSMVKYLSDNPEFVNMIDENNNFQYLDVDEIEKDIEKNGLQIYGAATYADKETLIEMYEDPAVYGIYIDK